ncbi:para-aminobenzoate synthase [Artomyces pyxidatus]|uniref:Para-aminobenzoate synthase n=1 Tax=Artomyces pyxidatus TaxID=48021 RepID=A0ACB8TI66_9AGAM|nr:para-aminobenzoate synthase [Artomyces pyxidatus]
MASTTSPHILLIDSYDSFTHNLAALCRRAIPQCHVHIVKNDALSAQKLPAILPCFAAVIVGPGPGSPDIPEDIGVIRHLWNLPLSTILPIFGVCLGLQSLAIESGARLRRLDVVKHGQISRIHHDGTGLFKGVGEAHGVRYHSLHVELRGGGEVEQLAWADDGEENGSVVMAIKHKTKPFWAVQYHPESVCTSGGGLEVLRNFWRLAKNWHVLHERVVRPWKQDMRSIVGPSWPESRVHSVPEHHDSSSVTTTILHLPDLPVAEICELFAARDESSPFVLLESAAQPGRFSIIGCVDPDSLRIVYSVGDQHVRVTDSAGSRLEPLGSRDIWSWLASFMRHRKASNGSPDIPFWGGLVGYLGYELGVDSLAIPLPSRKSVSSRRHPDVNLIFVERSIVVDSHSDDVYVQSLKENDSEWLQATFSLLNSAWSASQELSTPRHLSAVFSTPPIVTLPDKALYKSRIEIAKEHLFAGDSYELCLTAHTHVVVQPRADPTSSSWTLYKHLRTRNPAPHSGYLRLHPTTLLSSSPERFLSYSRPPHTNCQLRPIKGTVRKAPGITRSVAEELLAGSTKEVAENLMIVDLIRHDLHGVVGDDVTVKQFCRVEEYETVWQLVSVIEGGSSRISGDSSDTTSGELGWEVLRRSLPPGSMTGAPKKRSVEILQGLEDDDRSVYSGVFGYWCVGGSGDWSVVIRSCFKYDDRSVAGEKANASAVPDAGTEEWTIGAGGAITALSDVDAEWDEMTVKLQSVLRTFEAAAV